ncbi:hypothetical protein EON65_57345, partial [archaeon]
MASPINIRIWCHECADESTGHVNSDREILCDTCNSTFVEELDQGIEDFLEVEGDEDADLGEDEEFGDQDEESNPGTQEDMYLSSDSSVSPPAPLGSNRATNSDAMNSLMQSLENITGAFNTTATNTVNQRVLRSTDGPRPVGMIFRQTTVNETDGSMGLSQGLLSLLGALASSRQQSTAHNPDALSNASFEQLLHHILMNESSHAGAPPASESLIAQLSRQTVTPDSHVDLKGECSISQETFELGDMVVSLPCGHRYKEDSIVHWLKMHNTCPVCRIEVPPGVDTGGGIG